MRQNKEPWEKIPANTLLLQLAAKVLHHHLYLSERGNIFAPSLPVSVLVRPTRSNIPNMMTKSVMNYRPCSLAKQGDNDPLGTVRTSPSS